MLVIKKRGAVRAGIAPCAFRDFLLAAVKNLRSLITEAHRQWLDFKVVWAAGSVAGIRICNEVAAVVSPIDTNLR